MDNNNQPENDGKNSVSRTSLPEKDSPHEVATKTEEKEKSGANEKQNNETEEKKTDQDPKGTDQKAEIEKREDDDDGQKAETEKKDGDDQKVDEDQKTEIENKDGDQKDENEKSTGTTEGTEEEAPPPPEYTLEKALEEIDQFLPTISAPKPVAEGEEAASLEIPEFVEKFLDLMEETKIAKYESGDLKAKWGQAGEDDHMDFLDSLDRLSKLNKLINEFKSDPKHGLLINRISAVQQRAMSFLEDEFRILLEEYRSSELEQNANTDAKSKQQDQAKQQDQQQPEDETAENVVIPEYSPEIVSILNRIVKEMISAGYESECCQVYVMVRKHAFEETVNKIGFVKISIDDVQKMQREALEREIPNWISAFKECAAVHFTTEKKLTEDIFTDFPSIPAKLFAKLTRGMVFQFLNFAEGVAMTKRSAEKIFKLLDIYETLRDNIAAIENLFPEDFAQVLRTEATTTRGRMGEAAICNFCDLENSIKSDTGKTPVPGGAVHPLTRYTMNYLKYACEYKDTLEQVFKDHSKIERADSTSRPRAYDGSRSSMEEESVNQSPFSSQLVRVMDLLDANLEGKSKLYRDVALSCIFMMNNGRYILQKIKGSAEIHGVMGDTWSRRKSSDLRNFHKSYQRETWTKLLGCLSHEGLMNHGKVMKPVLKERFKNFNQMFDEIHRTQSTWVVHDEQMQSELRVSIQAIMIPAYRAFLARFAQVLDPGRQTEKYIKFQPEDIETYIEELFDGNSGSRRRV